MISKQKHITHGELGLLCCVIHNMGVSYKYQVVVQIHTFVNMQPCHIYMMYEPKARPLVIMVAFMQGCNRFLTLFAKEQEREKMTDPTCTLIFICRCRYLAVLFMKHEEAILVEIILWAFLYTLQDITLLYEWKNSFILAL